MTAEFEGIPGSLDDLSKSEESVDVSIEKPDEGSASEVVFHIPIVSTSDTDGRNQENDRHFQDISEQMNPMSPLKAVPMSGEQETLLSDDDTPKILTTLEPVKKKQDIQEQSNEKRISQENSQEELGHSDPESIARKQLETLNTLNRRKGRPKADEPRPIEVLRAHASNKKVQILENKVLSPSAEDIFSGLRNINMRPSRSLHSNILTREELTREIIQKCRKSTTSNDKAMMRSPQKRREEVVSTGTIEIPQELILSAEDTTPVIVHETESLEGQDLLAILEGDDEDGHETSVYELHTENSPKADDNVHVEEYTISLVTDPAKKQIDKEEEMEIAMKQIMSLPVKPKGRRPRKTATEDEPQSQKSKVSTASDLVSSLVSDWSDNEEKFDEIPMSQESQSETTVEVVVSTSQPQVTTAPLKSSRIIKKKVIWDPDAPETQFSYASKVQGSSSKSAADKIVVKRQQTPKVLVVEERSSVLPSKPAKRTTSVASVSGAKKRKLTEVDKLLGDEGAVNMIYSLERENNNSNLPEISAKPDKNQMVSKSKEKNTLVARAKAVRNVVIKQMVDAGQGTPRGRPKRDVSATQISPPTASKKTTPTKKRNTTRESVTSSTASESWDFLYSTPQGDDSMIIRRRSNSSYSGSTTSPRRLSIDQHHEDGGRKSNSFEFAKPVNKKTPKIDPSAAQNLVAELKGKLNQAISRGNVTIKAADGVNSVATGKVHSTSKITKDTPVKLRASERKLGNVEFKEITIRRYDNFVQLIFSPTFGSLKNVLTIGLLREVKAALGILRDDTKCKLVLVTSSGNNFCQGIDFSSLIQTTIDKKKSAAQQLSSALRDFLDALATFPKPLLAGVHGTVSDLGVTMLPLFDVVLSSEAATFCTNYAKIGQIPEANAVLNLSQKVSAKGITLLLFLCETLQAREACEHGLVTKTLWPDNFQDLLMENAKTISSYSLQTLEAIKTQSRQILAPKLTEALNEEHKILIQHWIGSECQEKFKKFLNNEEW